MPSLPAHQRSLQKARRMLQELSSTIKYGTIIWDHLQTATYDQQMASRLFKILSIAERTIFSIANSIAIRQRLNSYSILHPLTPLIAFYSAPIPTHSKSSLSVCQQVLDYRINPTNLRPFYWNNYFAPLFQHSNMSAGQDSDNEDMFDP